MYESFYGFKEKPFHIVPNSSTVYLSNKHQSALTYLEYGLAEAVGFILLTGEIGTGKTTLIRYLLKKIDEDMEVAVIFNTNVSAEQLLSLILTEFELSTVDNKAGNLDILNEYLIDRYSEGRRVLLIIDEAQNLSDEALEEVRMLSNLQSEEEMLLQIMLVGQPELRKKLQSPRLTQLTQRIAVNYHLSALTDEETTNYITYRLEKAGGSDGLFTPEAVALIYQASEGIPRTINLLCDSALVYGFADELSTIDKHIVEQVIQDKGEMGMRSRKEEGKPTSGDGSAGQPVYDPEANARFHDLETDIRKLQLQMDWYISEIEKRSNEYRDELILKFKDLLHQERKRNGKLIAELTRVREKYTTLKKKKQDGFVPELDPYAWEDVAVQEPQNKEKSKQSFFSWLKV